MKTNRESKCKMGREKIKKIAPLVSLTNRQRGKGIKDWSVSGSIACFDVVH